MLPSSVIAIAFTQSGDSITWYGVSVSPPGKATVSLRSVSHLSRKE